MMMPDDDDSPNPTQERRERNVVFKADHLSKLACRGSVISNSKHTIRRV